MNFKAENGILTIDLEGRVDSTNAPEIQAEIDQIKGENPCEKMVLDAEKLLYISSAGLRVILRLFKSGTPLKVTGVSTDIYEIFQATGFTDFLEVEKGYKQLSVEGCDVIGQGAKGTVYRYNPEIVVKVYKNPDSIDIIKRERELARKAFVLGIPTAISYDIVKVGELYGSVFELLSADSLTKIIRDNPEKTDEMVKAFADLLRQIHETDVKPEDMPDSRIRVYEWLRQATPFLKSEHAEKLKKMVYAIPEVMKMQHGDYHTNNVMMQDGEILLIDMDTLSHGHPIIELANVFVAYVGFSMADPKVVEDFIGLPVATTHLIWSKFLPAYLGTDDPVRVQEVDDKVRLLSYLRVIRHTARRGNDTEKDRELIAKAVEGIENLIDKVDSFDF